MKKLLLLLLIAPFFTIAQWTMNYTNGYGLESYQNSDANNVANGGGYPVAIGHNNIASGLSAISIGNEAFASGDLSFATGFGTWSAGAFSFSTGHKTLAYKDGSTAMGINTTAFGVNSFAAGFETTASDCGSFVIGQYNLAGYNVTSSDLEFNASNTAFVIGNGTASENRSDALVVKFNGDATLAGNLNINSDARLKANIISLGSTLSKLLQIDGKSYTMKKDESEKQKIGLLAQDIEKVFPELVSDSNGIKSVNYQGLVPVLINALKEQQEEIDRLKTQEERLERLEKLVAAMD